MQALETFLRQAGWKQKKGRWASKSGRVFHVHGETAPGGWDRSATAFLAQALLQAEARAGDAEPLAALKVRRASPLTDSRLARFVDAVRPGRSWILFDDAGRFFPHVVGVGELRAAASKQVVEPVPAEAPRRQASLFTDLNQWMLKVLLAPFIEERLLTAPRERPPRNAATLSEAAQVSVPAAFRFLRALEAEGQLDTRFGDLRVAQPLELLPRWRDQMGNPTRRELRATSARGASDQRLDEQLANLYGEPLPRRAQGVHAACDALRLGHVSGVPPVVWLERLDPATLKSWGFVPTSSEHQPFDVVLRVPRYPESLFRGCVMVDNQRVTDVIQCWLDASYHPVRGAEQADFVWRRVLTPAFS